MKKIITICIFLISFTLSINNIYADIITTGKNVKLFGNLKDKNNSPVQAKITAYKPNTTNLINSTQTDSIGYYSLVIPLGIYDIQLNLTNFSIPDFSITLLSVNISSDIQDLVNYITTYGSIISFSAKIENEQIIQIHSETKPARILVNGTNLTEVSSLSSLVKNTWFYNISQRKLYILPKTSTLKAIPEPGTPYKWLGLRIGQYDWNFENNDILFNKTINLLHPSVFQIQFPGDWWEPDNSQYWSTRYLPAMIKFTKYCQQNGVYSMVLFGNLENLAGVELGPQFMDKVKQYFDGLQAQGINPPTWFGLDEEWVAFGSSTTEVEVRNQIENLKNYIESRGSSFMIAVTRYWGTLPHIPKNVWQDYPTFGGTNYPFEYNTGNNDPVTLIDELDTDSYFRNSFGMKIGVIARAINPETGQPDPKYGRLRTDWNPTTIKEIYDHSDQTQHMGVLALDITPEFLNKTIFPYFIDYVNNESANRGYVTNLNIP